MTDPRMAQDSLQRAVFDALGAADAAVIALQNADRIGALAGAHQGQFRDLQQELETGDIFTSEHIPAIRSLSVSLEASIQAATVSHCCYDECDMSDGYQEQLTSKGHELVALRAQLNALARSLAEVRDHRRSKRIADELRN